MTTKQLNQQQARWAKFFSEFNFKISYKPEKKGEKPDILTRLAQDKLKRVDNFCQQHQFQTLLKVEHLDDNLRKAFAAIFCANTTENHQAENVDDKLVDEVDKIEVEENKNIVDVRNYVSPELYQHSNLQHNLEQSFSSTKMQGF